VHSRGEVHDGRHSGESAGPVGVRADVSGNRALDTRWRRERPPTTTADVKPRIRPQTGTEPPADESGRPGHENGHA
jgi:hypothetical protein